MSDLTKWPRLIVVGEPVTREQANEILVRTFAWSRFYTNDRAWRTAVTGLATEIIGFPAEPNRAGSAEYSFDHDLQLLWEERAGILDLHYLDTNRIASAWMGGPRGWCDWDGTIGCSKYNIGKHPSKEEVTEELALIASAFPYLTMHVQLITNEGMGNLAGTWAVRRGVAGMVEPAGPIAEPTELDRDEYLLAVMRGGERGVSLERLHEALVQVAAAQASGGRP